MQLNIQHVYADQSVSVTIPEQFRAGLGQGRATMRFASIRDASRYFGKLARKESRAKLNDRFGQAKLDANNMPIHTPQGKLTTERKDKRYKIFALK